RERRARALRDEAAVGERGGTGCERDDRDALPEAGAGAEEGAALHPPTCSCLMSQRSPDFSSLSVFVLWLLGVSDLYDWRIFTVAWLPSTLAESTWACTSIDLGRSMRSVRCFSHDARVSPPGSSKSGA